MTHRRQLSFEVAQMGTVWVASFSSLGISAIRATEAAALEAVLEAYRTQALSGQPMAES